MTIQRVETDNYFFVRKPHGIPTTFGSQFSFLEQIEQEKPGFFAHVTKEFAKDEEYGLLNRLDNDTAGFIYFAKTKKAKSAYLEKQAKHEYTKYYLAVLEGRVDIERTLQKHSELRESTQSFAVYDELWQIAKNVILSHNDMQFVDHIIIPEMLHALHITYPIMHHTHEDLRMVAIRIPKDEYKGRGEKHLVETMIMPLYYDENTHATTCIIAISQGIRHQIRVHTASIGYPIKGDHLYNNLSNDYLHLWSIGIGR